MKKEPTKFKVGDLVRVKSTGAARKLVMAVWLVPSAIVGRTVRVLNLNDMELGSPKHMCHRVCEPDNQARDLWVPPAALERVVKRKAAK